MYKIKYKVFLSTLLIFNFLLLPLVSNAAFNPNLIISDFEFRDHESMTMDDVQRFLVGKKSTLATYVDPFIRVRASQIIYDNAKMTKLNPKVLLVTLQKEQSLITDVNPTQDQYNWATGYGICDSCSKSDPKLQKFKGFANQVDYAATSLRLFHDNPQNYGFQVGRTVNIDGRKITIANSATHALYLYTPHLHGNENFNRIWSDWFSRTYPDGTLLQDADNGGIFIIQNGAKRPFDSFIAFASRYSLDKVIKTSTENLDSYPLGPPIKFAQYSLLQDNASGGVYLIVDDKKRPITSKEVFRQIGFNPEEIVPLDTAELATIATGQPITLKDAYPTGALLQDKTTGGVWYVKDGTRQAIWHRSLMDVNFPNLKLSQVSPEEIASFSLGEPVKFKDGELVKTANSPTVYVISNQLKRPIKSGKVFEKLGYKWNNIITTSDKALSLHLEGELVDVEI